MTFGDDSGHQSTSITDSSYAANDEALANYGGLALKKTHDVVMVLLKARDGAPPSKTYFFGSAAGGRDGLAVIQRWPADYDCIVVSRPALAYPGLRLPNVALGRALYLNGGAGWLDVAKTVMLENPVMKTCDTLDGAADGIISNIAANRAQSATVLASVRCAGGQGRGQHLPLRRTDRHRQHHRRAPYPLANGMTTYAGYNALPVRFSRGNTARLR